MFGLTSRRMGVVLVALAAVPAGPVSAVPAGLVPLRLNGAFVFRDPSGMAVCSYIPATGVYLLNDRVGAGMISPAAAIPPEEGGVGAAGQLHIPAGTQLVPIRWNQGLETGYAVATSVSPTTADIYALGAGNPLGLPQGSLVPSSGGAPGAVQVATRGSYVIVTQKHVLGGANKPVDNILARAGQAVLDRLLAEGLNALLNRDSKSGSQSGSQGNLQPATSAPLPTGTETAALPSQPTPAEPAGEVAPAAGEGPLPPGSSITGTGTLRATGAASDLPTATAGARIAGGSNGPSDSRMSAGGGGGSGSDGRRKERREEEGKEKPKKPEKGKKPEKTKASVLRGRLLLLARDPDPSAPPADLGAELIRVEGAIAAWRKAEQERPGQPQGTQPAAVDLTDFDVWVVADDTWREGQLPSRHRVALGDDFSGSLELANGGWVVLRGRLLPPSPEEAAAIQGLTGDLRAFELSKVLVTSAKPPAFKTRPGAPAAEPEPVPAAPAPEAPPAEESSEPALEGGY